VSELGVDNRQILEPTFPEVNHTTHTHTHDTHAR
jgi:hypothetical protein